MKEMTTITAINNGHYYQWYFSGLFWYCTEISRLTRSRLKKITPIGSGDSRDSAYKDFIELSK